MSVGHKPARSSPRRDGFSKSSPEKVNDASFSHRTDRRSTDIELLATNFTSHGETVESVRRGPSFVPSRRGLAIRRIYGWPGPFSHGQRRRNHHHADQVRPPLAAVERPAGPQVAPAAGWWIFEVKEVCDGSRLARMCDPSPLSGGVAKSTVLCWQVLVQHGQ